MVPHALIVLFLQFDHRPLSPLSVLILPSFLNPQPPTYSYLRTFAYAVFTACNALRSNVTCSGKPSLTTWVASPIHTGAHHSFPSFTAWSLSKITLFIYSLTCFFSVFSTRMFYHQSKYSICHFLHHILGSLPTSCHSTTVVRTLCPLPWPSDTTSHTRVTPALGKSCRSHHWKGHTTVRAGAGKVS